MFVKNVLQIVLIILTYLIVNGCSRHYYIQNQTPQKQILFIKYPISKQAEKNMKRLKRYERSGVISNLSKNISEDKATIFNFSLLSEKRMLLNLLLARQTIDTLLYPVICYPKDIKPKQNIMVCITAGQLTPSSKEKFTATTILLHSTRVIYIE